MTNPLLERYDYLHHLVPKIGGYSGRSATHDEIKEFESLKSQIEADLKMVENLKKLEYHVRKDGNEMYGIYCYNITGGCEFSTHYGYADKEHTIREFQSVFHFDVWDYETKNTYKYGELQSILRGKL